MTLALRTRVIDNGQSAKISSAVAPISQLRGMWIVTLTTVRRGGNRSALRQAVAATDTLHGLCHVGLRPAPGHAMSLPAFRAGHRYYYSARLQERRRLQVSLPMRSV